MSSMLLFILLPPLIGALAALCIPKTAEGSIRAVGIVATLVSLVFAIIAYAGFHAPQGQMAYTWSQTWFAFPNAYDQVPLVIHWAFGVDGLSLPFVAVTALISALAMIVGKVKDRVKWYTFWMLLLSGSLIGVFISTDLLIFFLALELTLVATYFLLLQWGGADRRRVATKFLIYRGMASVGILVAFVGMVYAAGNAVDFMTTDVSNLANIFKTTGLDVLPYNIRVALFLTVFFAVLIEEALVPFHTWLPDALAESNTPVSMMIGGVVVKTGAYILLRVGSGILTEGIQLCATWLAVFGVINIIYAALVAVAQKDWRRLVAYSTMSHMGLVLLSVGALTDAGYQGAIFMTISSGLLTALLLFLIGRIRERTNTALIGELGGLSKPMPVIAGVLLVGSLGSLGLPGMSGFISEIISFTGTFRAFPVLSSIGVLGMILAALYLLWAMQRTTFGPTEHASEGAAVYDARPLDYVPMVALLAVIIAIGVYPSLLGHVVNQAVETFHALMA